MNVLWLQLLSTALVIVFAIVGYFIWDRRYRGARGDSFKRTNEVFKDPTTGRLTRVFEDPTTGKREYRDESERED